MATTSKARQARRKAKQPVLPVIKTEYKTIDVRPTPELISIQSYWTDIKNRSSIHAYEVNEAMNDLRTAVQWTYVQYNKLCDKIKEVAP
tara:strand:- start:262 stop:528 length:267 start_codon:yes stop_codon:yes gene_type:complete